MGAFWESYIVSCPLKVGGILFFLANVLFQKVFFLQMYCVKPPSSFSPPTLKGVLLFSPRSIFEIAIHPLRFFNMYIFQWTKLQSQ